MTLFYVSLAIIVTLCAGNEESSNELVSNSVEDGSSTAVTVGTSSRKDDVDRQQETAAGPQTNNMSLKSRRSRYLRQAYRPRRRPPFDARPRNARRPPVYPTYADHRHHFKPARPYTPAKSRFRYHENWRHKWPEHNQPYSPYAAPVVDDDEEESAMVAEPYDEYDELDEPKHDEQPWLSPKKYRNGYEDAMLSVPSSKYSEKRSPTRYAPNVELLRGAGRLRPGYDLYDSVRKDSQAAWLERSRLMTKNYRDLLELLASKKLVDAYDDSFAPSRVDGHRFRLSNLARLKNLEDDYDFAAAATAAAANGLKLNLNRYKSDQSLEHLLDKPDDVRGYEPDAQNVAKYVAAAQRTAFPIKLELPHEVVYSAKYRGAHHEPKESVVDAKRTNVVEKLKMDEQAAAAATTLTDDFGDWKRNQRPTYHEFHLADAKISNYGGGAGGGDDKVDSSAMHSVIVGAIGSSSGGSGNGGSSVSGSSGGVGGGSSSSSSSSSNVGVSHAYNADQLLPSDLIAYMSANPAEQVVGKEERYVEPTYPYDIFKAVFPRKISPVIDHDLEITFDERLNDWKH